MLRRLAASDAHPSAQSIPRALSLWTPLALSRPQIVALTFLYAQILVAVAVPPLQWRGFKLFPCDLTLLIGAVAGATYLWRVKSPRFAQVLRLTSLGTGLLLLAWLHGSARPPLVRLETLVGVQMGPGSFSPFREAVISLRLFSWLLGATTVVGLFRHFESVDPGSLRALVRSLKRGVAPLGAVLAGLTIASFFLPSFQDSLSRTYHLEIPADIWRHRAFGVFQSPLEGGITFGLLAMIVMESAFESLLGGLSLILLVLAIFCTSTASSLATVLILGIYGLHKTFASPRFSAFLLLSWTFSISCLGATCLRGMLNTAKFGGGWARALLWEEYVESLTGRWDTLLLGFGFHPYYVDNSYLWIFSRFGLIGVLTLGMWISLLVIRSWGSWSSNQKGLVLFLAITGLSLDTLILRPVVSLFICVVLPLLISEAQAPASD